jgi:hypothetical protein
MAVACWHSRPALRTALPGYPGEFELVAALLSRRVHFRVVTNGGSGGAVIVGVAVGVAMAADGDGALSTKWRLAE